MLSFPMSNQKNWEDTIPNPLAWQQKILHVRQVPKKVSSDTKWAFFDPFYALALLLMGSGEVTWEIYGFLSSAEWSKFLLGALGLSCIKYVDGDRF